MNNQITSNSFLGRGWSFPPTFVAAAHAVMMTEGQEDVQRSLEILLTTALGERVMLPDYGSSVEDLLFEPVDTSLQTLLVDRVKTAILYHEARIEVETIVLHTDRLTEGILVLEVIYHLRTTNSRFNFVFPFYKNEGSEVGVLS